MITSILDDDNSDTLYGVLEVAGTDTDIFNNTSASVKIITSDGKEEVYAIDTDEIKEATIKTYPTKDDDDSDDVLIAYTLNDDGEVDSIEIAKEANVIGTAEKGAEMKTNGVLVGKTVSDDVAVFYNNGDPDDPDYVVYGFKALEDSDEIYGRYILNDDGDEIMAILLINDLESTDDVFGFITDIDSYKNTNKKDQADVTALVDGKEVVYTTEEGYVPAEVAQDVLVKIDVNSDNELKSVEVVTKFYEFAADEYAEIQDDFKGADAVAITNKVVKDKKNNSLDISEDSDAKDYQSVSGAAVYYLNEDNELEISSYAKIKKDYIVSLYQTDDDSSAWNIVVYYDPEEHPAAAAN